VQYLLQAFSELNLENSELVLKGKVQGEMQKVVEGYRSPNIKFINWVGYLPELYNQASVCILPSVEDGFGLVTVEAMACGKPVIITENTGMVARDGKDGFVIPIRDVEAIKDKLLYFYENPGEIRKMGNNARKHIAGHTWTRYGDELCKAYRGMLE
jgi:glycosyltransferase involved in cell wall biosynthesis